MPVNKEQQKKSVNGNKFERRTYDRLRNEANELKIERIKKKKRFYYSEKTIEQMIADEINSKKRKYTKAELTKIIKRLAKNTINSKSGDVLRSKNKFYKESDNTFMTKQKYLYDGKLSNIRFIVDNTTSARTDRLKGKAQDSAVYKRFGFAYIYIIELPEDEHFKNYKKTNQEIKYCENAIYDANFCNVYKDENVSLVVRENDLFDLLKYISKHPGKDINKLIVSWKNRYYRDMVSKRKLDIENYTDKIVTKTLKLVDESMLK